MYLSICAQEKDFKKELKDDDIRHYYIPGITDKNVDNIADENKFYSELTCLYDLWKNHRGDIVGLEHYRRFFVTPDSDVWNHENAKKIELIGEKEIKDILDNNDIILCRQYVPAKNALTFCFSTRHNAIDKDSVHYKLFVDWFEYLRHYNYHNDFIDFMIRKMSESNSLYANNMFISNYDTIDEYCNWLFPSLENFRNIYYKEGLPLRSMGYLAEWTMGYWMMYHKKRIYDLYKVVYKDNFKGYMCSFTKEELNIAEKSKEAVELMNRVKTEYNSINVSKTFNFSRRICLSTENEKYIQYIIAANIKYGIVTYLYKSKDYIIPLALKEFICKYHKYVKLNISEDDRRYYIISEKEGLFLFDPNSLSTSLEEHPEGISTKAPMIVFEDIPTVKEIRLVIRK